MGSLIASPDRLLLAWLNAMWGCGAAGCAGFWALGTEAALPAVVLVVSAGSDEGKEVGFLPKAATEWLPRALFEHREQPVIAAVIFCGVLAACFAADQAVR